MQFVFPSLTWGFLLALLPLLIHLINLVRRRRVQWAAMQFLLQSYRKHRTWIWLQQWLLLLLRTAAIVVLVAMLAQWVTQREWFALFGKTATHHFILLDDSYSMTERSAGTTAFDLAEQAFANIVAQARNQETIQRVTLLRFSNARIDGEGQQPVGVPDLNADRIGPGFETTLAEVRRQLRPTQLATSPLAALRVTRQLMGVREDEINLIYVLSDFRAREWSSAAELKSALAELEENGGKLHFVDCAVESPSNLAISELTPAEDTRAAGVPLFVNLRVTNHGQRVERKVPVQLRTRVYDPVVVAASRPGESVSRREEPPALLIDEIRPGESVTAQAQVYFPVTGGQVVEAILPDDSVAADNRRWCVVDLPDGEPVLVIDGSAEQRHAYHVISAFAPGRQAETGIRPDPVRTPAFLRDSTDELLQRYRAIYLLDVPRLDGAALERLTNFVRGGGGLGIFGGENVNWSYYRDQFYNQGQGLFPVPIGGSADLPPEIVENNPDLEVRDHPVFAPFFGEQNPLIRWVRIGTYLKPAADWSAASAAPVEVLAQLRNGDPLVVARPFGAGRVAAVLTTAAPVWNNWANDPSFVVVMLKLHAYLAAPMRRTDRYTVGAPIEVSFAADTHRSDVTFVAPRGADQGHLVLETTAEPVTPEDETMIARLSRSLESPNDGPTDQSGIYEAWTYPISGDPDVRRMAVNVEPREGTLDKLDSAAVLEQLAPLDVAYHDAGDYASPYAESSAANRSLLLMGLLISLLLGEQLLAFSTSFHPQRQGAH